MDTQVVCPLFFCPFSIYISGLFGTFFNDSSIYKPVFNFFAFSTCLSNTEVLVLYFVAVNQKICLFFLMVLIKHTIRKFFFLDICVFSVLIIYCYLNIWLYCYLFA